MKKQLSVLSIVISSLLINGCTEQDAQKSLSTAENLITTGDVDEATIALKNVLQIEPDNAKARFLLGKVYANRGASNAAEKELTFALDYGYDKSDVYRYLAPSLYLQMDSFSLTELINDLDSVNDLAKVTVLAYDALLSFEVGDINGAQIRFNQINDIDRESHYLTLLNAYKLLSANRIDESIAMIEKLKLDVPDFADAIFMLGRLYSAKGNHKGAAVSFKEYLEFHPEDSRGAVFLANSYVKSKQFEKATPIINKLLAINEEQPFINFLKSVIMFNQKDFEMAKLASDKAIQNGYKDNSARIINGLSAYRLGNKEQAFNQFSIAKDKLPPNSPILGLLSALALELGYTDEAVDAIIQKNKLNDADVLLLSSASADLINQGDVKAAKSLNKKIKSIDVTTEQGLLARGMATLSLEELSGITDIEKAVALSPESGLANTILARAYLNNKMYEKAITLAEQWQKEHPELANGFSFAGMVYEKQSLSEQAMKNYSLALEKDNSEPLANLYFANLAYENGSFDEALNYVNSILRLHPAHLEALVKSFVIHNKMGDPEKGLVAIESALGLESTKNFQAIKIIYASALFNMGRKKQVIEYLQNEENEDMPNDFWVLLGNSLYQTGRVNESLELANEWMEKQPNNPVAYLRFITMLDLTGDLQQALHVARVALTKFDNPSIKFITLDLAIRNDDLRVAHKTIDLFTKEEIESNTGQLLRGQLLLANNNNSEAVATVESAYREEPSDRGAWLLAKAYLDSGKPEKAYELYRNVTDLDSAPHAILMQFAELAIRNNDASNAIILYKKALTTKPDDVKALNNLAYLLSDSGASEDAIMYSEKAVTLMPNNFDILDTHATVLWKSGRLNDSISLFEKLYSLQPHNEKLIKKYSDVLIEADYLEKAQTILGNINQSQY